MVTPAPIIAIVGQTASGKSALALNLARLFDGEIICADSRTIYQHLDIGTAKPSAEDQKMIPHHLLDIMQPNEQVTAATFKHLANAAINTITAKGKLPILAGGSGLYIDSVLYDFQFLPEPDLEVRQRLEALSIEELQEMIVKRKLPMPSNHRNKRHLTRVIETNGIQAKKQKLRPNCLIMGLTQSNEQLKQRITARVEMMLEAGLIDEVETLLVKYGVNCPALKATGYKPFVEYLNGTINLADATQQFIKNDLHLAKRQKTWFKRNNSIQWLDDPLKAVEITTTFLSKIKR